MTEKKTPMRRLVVMSIRPTFAAAAYENQKRFEYRRVRTTLKTGDRVLVYETAPTSLLTGEFQVGRVCVGTPEELARLESSRQLRRIVLEYLDGARVATALEICRPIRWREPLPLCEIRPDAKPPQSYMFIERVSDGILRSRAALGSGV